MFFMAGRSRFGFGGFYVGGGFVRLTMEWGVGSGSDLCLVIVEYAVRGMKMGSFGSIGLG